MTTRLLRCLSSDFRISRAVLTVALLLVVAPAIAQLQQRQAPTHRVVHHEQGGDRTAQIPSYPQSIQVGTVQQRNASTLGGLDSPAQGLMESQMGLPGCSDCGTACALPIGTPFHRTIHGVHSDSCGPCGEMKWNAMGPIPWEVFAQGEYIGPARLRHVPEYRLRVDDNLDFVYLRTRKKTSRAYRLGVGDQVRIQSLTTPEYDREVEIQPDGSVTLLQLGQVTAAGETIEEFNQKLNEEYKRFINDPQFTVTPLTFNISLEDIINSVDRRAGSGGQSQVARVTPEGTVQLPGIGSVYVQGLTLTEVEREVEERYNYQFGEGLEITPILSQRAPRFVYVAGEVQQSGRFTLEGPTTVMQSLALAGSWNIGANLNQVVVFRRDHNWRLMATKLDIRGALYGRRPCPADEIWLRDGDIVVVPKSPILEADEFIDLFFTRGLYGIVPFDVGLSFSKLTTL